MTALVETILGTRHGDVNLDGVIDVLDLAVMADQWNTLGALHWSRADLTGDGLVGPADLQLLAANWHFGLDEPGQPLDVRGFLQSVGHVPEPGSFVLLALGICGMMAAAAVRRHGTK